MTLLQTMKMLRERKAAGRDCDEPMRHLLRHLDRFRSVPRLIARGILADEDDLIQEVACKILERDQFRGHSEGEAAAYCREAIRNRTLDYKRRAKGRLMFAGGKLVQVPEHGPDLDSDPRCDDSTSTAAGGEQTSPEEGTARRELGLTLRRALDQLPVKERELLLAVVAAGKQIVTLSDGTLKDQNKLSQRKKRALRRLAQLLPANVVAEHGRTALSPGEPPRPRPRKVSAHKEQQTSNEIPRLARRRGKVR